MAYVYGKLKEAILGNHGDKISRDMSPNMIKALFIGRTNIVVAYHTRSCRVIQLDYEKVCAELGNGGARNESLNNVLNKYKMGCVEEIYADAAYRNIPGGYLDLGRYVDSLGRCRLRFWGWYNGDASAVQGCYEQARMNHNYMYCVANDASVRGKLLQIEANPVSGKADAWYTVHDLRPNDYYIDGSLEKYFAKVDSELKSKVVAAETEAKEKGAQALSEALVQRELGFVKEYQVYRFMYTLVKRGYFGDVGSALKNHLFGVQTKCSIKRATDIVVSTDKEPLMSKVESCARLIVHSGDDSTCLFRNIPLDELSDRLESGEGLFGTKSAYCNRLKSLIRCGNSSRVILLSAYNSMVAMGCRVRCSVEDMVEVIEIISEHDSSWFEEYNQLVLNMLGFSSSTALMSFAKEIGAMGGTN